MEKLKYLNQNTIKLNINKLNKSKSINHFVQLPQAHFKSESTNADNSLFKENKNLSQATNKGSFNSKKQLNKAYLLPSKIISKSASTLNFTNFSDFNRNCATKDIELNNNFSFMKKNYLQVHSQTGNQFDQFQRNNQNSQMKMDRLCQKLQSINIKKQTNIQVQINESILTKIEELNQKLFNQERSLQENIKANREKLQDFYKKMNQIDKRSQFFTSYRLKNIIELGRKVRGFLQKQKNERAQIEEKLIKIFQQKSDLIQSSIISMIKAREELVFKIDSNLQQIVPSFHEELQFQLTIMVQQMTQLQKIMNNQILQFKNAVTIQNKHYKESRSKIQELMKKTASQIRAQVQHQKTQRQRNGQKLMEIFQQACFKLTN